MVIASFVAMIRSAPAAMAHCTRRAPPRPTAARACSAAAARAPTAATPAVARPTPSVRRALAATEFASTAATKTTATPTAIASQGCAFTVFAVQAGKSTPHASRTTTANRGAAPVTTATRHARLALLAPNASTTPIALAAAAVTTSTYDRAATSAPATDARGHAPIAAPAVGRPAGRLKLGLPPRAFGVVRVIGRLPGGFGGGGEGWAAANA